MLSDAATKIDKELDVAEFIKHQFINKVSRRLIFTRLQRHLMRHQVREFVLDEKHKHSSEADSSDCEPDEFLHDKDTVEFNQTFHRKLLIQALFRSKP